MLIGNVGKVLFYRVSRLRRWGPIQVYIGLYNKRVGGFEWIVEQLQLAGVVSRGPLWCLRSKERYEFIIQR